jgi:hypothetical protein
MTKDRDTSVDELLAAALAKRGVASASGCLDAETIAAWADGALDVHERASAEAHAADCPRCQELLAAMVRTLPATATKAPWRKPAFGWLIPLTAAATALVIWIAVPAPAPVQVSETAKVVDQVEPTPSSTPSSSASAADKKAAVPEAESPSRNQAAASDAMAAAPARNSREATSLEKGETASEKEAMASPQKSANALAETMTIAPAGPPAGAAASAASAAAPTPALSPPARPESADASSNFRRDASAPARVSAFASGPETVVVSSNPSTRFRLLRGGGVQRSADGGATWRTEVTGATDTLTAGASPSPSVCWLVGPSGTVLISTSGAAWRRLGFPEAVDLRSVTASDGDTATVTAVDGRSFVTTDGGRTWSRAQGH